MEMLKEFDEDKFKEDLVASGKSESGARWKEFDNFWINTKLKPDKIMPSVANRGGSVPQRDNLQGARYLRVTFADGSKAITTDVFLEKSKPEKSKPIFETKKHGLDGTSGLRQEDCISKGRHG